jgi:nitrogen fixation protein
MILHYTARNLKHHRMGPRNTHPENNHAWEGGNFRGLPEKTRIAAGAMEWGGEITLAEGLDQNRFYSNSDFERHPRMLATYVEVRARVFGAATPEALETKLSTEGLDALIKLGVISYDKDLFPLAKAHREVSYHIEAPQLFKSIGLGEFSIDLMELILPGANIKEFRDYFVKRILPRIADILLEYQVGAEELYPSLTDLRGVEKLFKDILNSLNGFGDNIPPVFLNTGWIHEDLGLMKKFFTDAIKGVEHAMRENILLGIQLSNMQIRAADGASYSDDELSVIEGIAERMKHESLLDFEGWKEAPNEADVSVDHEEETGGTAILSGDVETEFPETREVDEMPTQTVTEKLSAEQVLKLCGINALVELYSNKATVDRVRYFFKEYGVDFEPFEPVNLAIRACDALEGTVIEDVAVDPKDFTNFDQQVIDKELNKGGLSIDVALAVLDLVQEQIDAKLNRGEDQTTTKPKNPIDVLGPSVHGREGAEVLDDKDEDEDEDEANWWKRAQ